MTAAGAFLRVVSGARQGLSIPLRPDQPLLIGRSRGDLLLDDPLVSGAHCRIVSRANKFVLQDLGSTNGTTVDGRRVQESPLRAGSEIVIGTTRLLLFSGEESEDAEGPGAAGKVAWLLDGELASGETLGGEDLIGQGLRLPPRFDGRVEVVAGPDVGKIYRFTRGSLTIGRRQGEISLSDVEISRRHAYIEVFGVDMVFLRDVFSTNGTYHNGRRVQVARLVAGDTIGVGKTVMRYYGA
ncbi:MAG TPA: FHA domain-containing protein [Myxococcota bacterium]|nr:FHA domain-containing protein [Myxococcota bacterium]